MTVGPCKPTSKLDIMKLFIVFTAFTLKPASLITDADRMKKLTEIASETLQILMDVFAGCLTTTNQEFTFDNLQKYAFYPAKTTVGLAPRYTTNRKFFTNMLASRDFKEMLGKDEDMIRKNLIKKIKYCNEHVMSPNILKTNYDKDIAH